MPVNIRGKNYITVAERVSAFNEQYPNGSITTELVYPTDESVRAKATVYPDVSKPERMFIGHCEEIRSSSTINKTSATENCETGAVGRALGFLGLGVVEGIASADEVNKAIAREGHVATEEAFAPPFDESLPVEEIKAKESVKTCLIHKKPLKSGQYGWYCATKMPDGKWCPTKMK